MTSNNWITIDDLANLTSKSSGAIRVALHRNRMKIRSQYKIIPSGRQLQISIDSLVENKWITADQANNLTVRQSVQIPATEGNQLLASSIIRKKFVNLSQSERDLLNQIPNWQSLGREEIVKIFVTALGKSRAWYYRDHSMDRRREKDTALAKLDDKQLVRVEQMRISCRMQKAFVDKCMNDELLPDLSNSTWRRIYRMLGVGMQNEIAYVKEGPLKMRSRLAPLNRDKTHLLPLETIVGDFWRVDFATKWIDGSLARPSCAVWVDWRTNKIVGVALTRFPNSLGVKTSLLDCFLHYGIPHQAYIDNGKEYVAHRVIGRKCEEVKVALDLTEVDDKLKIFEAKGFLPSMGINNRRALKRNPQTKIVERLFGRGGFTDYAKEFSNWIGENYWKTPEAVARAARKFKTGDEKEYVDARTGEVIHFMDLSELSSAIAGFVARHNERASTGFGMDGKTPNDLWNELTAVHPPRRASIERIAYAFMEGKAARVRTNGYIELKKQFFFTSEALLRNSGINVHLRWNPIDGFWWNRADEKQFEFLPREIFVYTENGDYLTTAQFVDRLHPTKEDPEKIAALMSTKMKVIKEAGEHVNHLLGPAPTIVDVKTTPADVLKAAEEKKKIEKEEQQIEEKKQNQYTRIKII
jgi:hypothetical protein